MKNFAIGIVVSILLISTAVAESPDESKIVMFKMDWLMFYVSTYCGWPGKAPSETSEQFLIWNFPEEDRLGRAQADLENPILNNTIPKDLYCSMHRPLYDQYHK